MSEESTTGQSTTGQSTTPEKTPPWPTRDELVDEGERRFADLWKLIAAQGVLGIAFGTMLIVWPDLGLSTLVWLLGIYLIVRGVLVGFGRFTMPQGGSERRWLTLESVLSIGVGIAVLAWPDISAKALLYVIAAFAIALGVLLMASALYLPLSGGRRVLLSLSGMIFAAFGAVMFIEPSDGAIAQIALVASLLIVTGVTLVAFAFELRGVGHEAKDRLKDRQTAATTKPVTHG